MQEFVFRGNELYCEDIRVRDVVREHGTPLYVYSAGSVVDHCRHIESAFGTTPHLTCYAVKANANRAILSLIAGEGIGADVGSVGELMLAISSGFPPERITYSGVGKRKDEIEAALKIGILSFNVESEPELELVQQIAASLGVTANILVRVNLDIDAETHPYITTGRKHNKFGVDRSTAEAMLLRSLALPNLHCLGVHIHLGSQIVSAPTFLAAAGALVSLVGDLRRKGIPVDHVNVGGGFGVQYRDYVSHPLLPKDGSHAEADITVAGFIRAIVPALKDIGCLLLIQPGRSIIAHAGLLAMEVLYTKQQTGRTFVIVDAGMNDFMRPALYQSYHQIVPLCVREGNHMQADIVGPLCESGDFFALDRSVPPVQSGDVLALMCAGAYGYVLSSNYNARPRPAEALVRGGTVTIVRQRESIDHL